MTKFSYSPFLDSRLHLAGLVQQPVFKEVAGGTLGTSSTGCWAANGTWSALQALLGLIFVLQGTVGCVNLSTPKVEARSAPILAVAARERVVDGVSDEAPFSFAGTVAKVRPCVATLSVLQNLSYRATMEVTTGSGVVLDQAGYVLTCDHVVENADAIRVQLPDRPALEAKIVGRDPLGDLALLKVDSPEALPFLELGDSQSLRAGDFVLAFGNPFNHSRRDGEPSVSMGIVSALRRTTFPQGGRRRYTDAIQIDASINPGNSGGPVTDGQGRLMALVGVISSKTGYSAGVAFAIPAHRIRAVYSRLRQGEVIEHAWLGVVPVDRSFDAVGQAAPQGVLLVEVLEDHPAYRAGVRRDDVLLSLDGKLLANTAAFINAVGAWEPGRALEAIVDRQGERLSFTIVPGARPTSEDMPWRKR